MRIRRFRLVAKSTLLFAAFLVPIMAGVTFFSAQQSREAIMRGLEQQMDVASSIVPETLVQPLQNSAFDQIRFIAWRIGENETIVGVKVSRGDRLIAQFVGEDMNEEYLRVREVPIVVDDGMSEPETIGQVELSFTEEFVRADIAAGVRSSILESVVILLVIMLLVVLLLSRVVVRPVSLTSGRMKEIAEGEADLQRRLTVPSRDEIGELAEHFNAFVANLDTLIGDVRRSLDLTLEAQSDLSANSEESSAAITEMTANIDSAKQQIEILNETVTTSSSTIDGIVEQIQETINQVGTQGTMVEQTVSSVTELLASIESVSSVTDRERQATDKLVESARDGETKIEETNELVTNIAARVEEIEQLVSIIDSIASQTNLLAMNAAIEAAHAGDAGRGFAVVAEEIRKLAESSAENATSIGGVLKDIIGRIEQASVSTDETVAAFAQISREVSSVSDSLDQIAHTLTEMNTGSREIHDAMGSLQGVSTALVDSSRQMQSGSEELSASVDRIRNVSQVVSGAMAEIRTGTGEINRAMDQISQVNLKLGENARDVGEKVARFKTTE
jgi:methyl-accepting chemotaxis protein